MVVELYIYDGLCMINTIYMYVYYAVSVGIVVVVITSSAGRGHVDMCNVNDM